MATVIRSLGLSGISGYPLSVKEAKDRMDPCTQELGYAYPVKEVVFNLSSGNICEVLAANGQDCVAGVAGHNHSNRFAPLWSQRNLGQVVFILWTHEAYHIADVPCLG